MQMPLKKLELYIQLMHNTAVGNCQQESLQLQSKH